MAIYTVQIPKQILAGSGCSLSDTSIVLKSFKFTDNTGATTNVTMAMFGTIGYGTLEAGTAKVEQISFTGITQNGNGTATLTGVVRGLAFTQPYATASTQKYSHAGGTEFVISNTAAFYTQFLNPSNTATITALFTFTVLPQSTTVPTTGPDLTNKTYVDLLDSANVKLTGIQTIAGVKTFSSLPTIPLTPSASTDAASKGYVDGVAFAGAPNASTTVKGIVEEATLAEVQAGTGAGATGARLFLNPSSVITNGKFDISLIPNLKFGGTGADGALTLTSGATNIDVGGAQVYVKNYTSISITGTGSLTFSNPHANGTVVILKSTLGYTLTSSTTPMIDVSGMGASGGTGNSATGANSGSQPTTSGTNGTLNLIRTNTNSTTTGGAIATLLTNPPVESFTGDFRKYIQKYMPLFVGAGGGGGGYNVSAFPTTNNGTAGAGGRGGGCLVIECVGSWNFTTANGISVAGKNGGNGVYSSGGGLEQGGGGGGGGGFCLVMYNTLTANSGTITVSGGTGGNTGSNGGSTTGAGGGGSATNAGSNGASGGNGAKSGGDGGAGLSLVALNTEFI